jgi:hypothetical protein
MLDTKTLVAAMARRCGLEDPDRFALAGGVAAKSSAFRDAIARLTGKPWAPPKDLEHALRLRGTGRTTRMLLEVLVALQCGCKVDIVTYNDHAAVDLGSDLVALCVAGKIDMTSFHYRIRTPTSKISIVGENATMRRSTEAPLVDAVYFSDHHVEEMDRLRKRVELTEST